MSGTKGPAGAAKGAASRTAAAKGVPTPMRTGKQGSGVQGASIDDLATRLGAIQGVDEDTANFIAHNWTKLLGGLVIVLLSLAVAHMYRDAKDSRRGAAAQQFSEISQLYESLVLQQNPDSPESEDPSADPKKLPQGLSADAAKNLESMFVGKLPALENTDRGQIYGSLAGLYRVADDLRKGDAAAARENLAKIHRAELSGLTHVRPMKEVQNLPLADELAAMLAARVELLDGKTDRAREQFVGIVRGGRFLNLEALIALVRLDAISGKPAATPAGAASLAPRDLALELVAARPELRDVVSRALQDQGIVLSDAS